MKPEPLARNYFSPNPGRERCYRRWLWMGMGLSVLFLALFWHPLRSTEFTYSLVSLAMANRSVFWLFQGVTLLGSPGFLVCLFAVAYWSYNKALAFWGLVLVPTAVFVTSEVPKDIIRLPRPDVRGVSVPTYTFPSGHTSGAVSAWGYVAVRFKRRGIWLLALCIIPLVGLSRVFLGYHFLGDVLGGIVTGTAFLALVLGAAMEFAENGWEERFPPGGLYAVAFIIPLILSFIPAGYAHSLMGFVAGVGPGYLWERRALGFHNRGSRRQHLLRLLLGFAVLALLVPALDLVLPRLHAVIFVQHALAGLWIVYLAPLVFVRLSLADHR